MIGSQTCCSPCRNSLLINFGNNELASAPLEAFSKSSGSQAPFPYASTLRPTPNIALASVIPSTNNELFKKFMKAYLRAQVQPPTLFLLLVQLESQKQPFKICFPKLYFRNLYIEYYNFCQQYKNHFKIACITSSIKSFLPLSFYKKKYRNNNCSINVGCWLLAGNY